MSALRTGRKRAGGTRSGLFGFSYSAEGYVLPRLLRRPVRLFARLTGGEIIPPRYSATIMTAAFFAATGLYGAYVGGHMPELVQSVTARTGFAVDQVRVTGHRETSEIDILERLELDGWTSLIGFDADAARTRVASLPWVEIASVRKVYPNTLEVQIEERKPFAIWQHGRELAVVEASGRVIAPFNGARHMVLPLVIGQGAAEAGQEFVKKVKAYPELAARVKGYIRVAERRWDLRLENGVTVKLPEHGEDEAINELLAMDREDGLLSRDIAAVDMRFSDRVVVQLTPEAAERRAEAVAAMTKGRKAKSEKKI
ncbi:cell division protein FtsQ/DivIB [Rhizobiaceae sp. 2RAB30]